ncbi:methyltransferase [Candidatus Sororendozoicomonas aggregata]|uniref:methyltransferase n=1 Tax=Candidatus Sororendozoicomonas aggregata TaxID=3073239 RepID=UPI002ED69C67
MRNNTAAYDEIRHLLLGMFISRSLTAVAELNIAELLHNGPQSVDMLAKETDSDPDALYRVLRTLAAVNVFEELKDRTFKNNALSDTLRIDAEHSAHAIVRWINDPGCWASWGRLDYSIKTGRPATEAVLGSDLFTWLQEHPSSLKRFQEAMTGFCNIAAHGVVETFDFSAINKIVDIGGGHGLLLGKILTRYHTTTGVLFDRPEVIDQALPLLTKLGVADRVETVAGDFFEHIPSGADAYIMKHVLHDWDDKHCMMILNNCHNAMKPNSRLLVVEAVMDDGPNSLFAKQADLETLVITTGGRERTQQEFADLFSRCGLKLQRLIKTDYPAVILEAVAH